MSADKVEPFLPKPKLNTMKILLTILPLISIAFLATSCQNQPAAPVVDSAPATRQKIDVLVFDSWKSGGCPSAVEWVRSAKSQLSDEVGSYVETNTYKDAALAKQLQVTSTPMVVVLRNHYEIGRFVPTSTKQVTSMLKGYYY